MNVTTKLTFLRIVLTIIMIVILIFPFYLIGFSFPQYEVGGIYIRLEYIIAGIVFIIASFTDFLDGY